MIARGCRAFDEHLVLYKSSGTDRVEVESAAVEMELISEANNVEVCIFVEDVQTNSVHT